MKQYKEPTLKVLIINTPILTDVSGVPIDSDKRTGGYDAKYSQRWMDDEFE